MKTRIINLWDKFRESFWFVPIVMTSLAAIAAVIVNGLDHRYAERLQDVLFWAATDPSSARSALSAIASAMLTLVGVIFSITMVAVSMASSQYGSRLLRCYMTDSLADYVMGMFVGTGIYCLITLRSIRDSNVDVIGFTPHLSVAIGVAAGLISVALLIYFIHDVATSIQAPNIVRALAKDLDDAIERLYPDPIDNEDRDGSGSTPSESKRSDTAMEIVDSREGYVAGIDIESLLATAEEHDLLLKLSIRPGQFMVSGERIAEMRVQKEIDKENREALTNQVRASFVIESRRTPRQDIVCSILELVDIAVRSLSPGVNDPFTAMNCIDRLAASMCKLVKRQNPQRSYCDESGEQRVVWKPATSSDAIQDAFRQIRQYGASSVAVSIRMVEALSKIANQASRDADIEAIRAEAFALRDEFLAQAPQEIDKRDFENRFESLNRCVRSKFESSDQENLCNHAEIYDAMTG